MNYIFWFVFFFGKWQVFNEEDILWHIQSSKSVLREYNCLISLKVKECDCDFQSCSYCSTVTVLIHTPGRSSILISATTLMLKCSLKVVSKNNQDIVFIWYIRRFFLPPSQIVFLVFGISITNCCKIYQVLLSCYRI